MRQMKDLPLLDTKEKNEIMGFDAPPWPEKVRQPLQASGLGVPLFWQEAKPVQLLAKVFSDFNIEHVFDLTPGTS